MIPTKDLSSPEHDVTAAAFGDIYDMSDGELPVNRGGSHKGIISGDTWYTTWGKDGQVYLSHDDGQGFDNPDGLFARCRLCRLEGDPNTDSNSFRGVNLNPGILGHTLPHYEFTDEYRIGYSSSIYDLDGTLYIIRHNWSPPKELWPPIESSIIKSTDGGRNWINHLGQTNVLAGREQCMFPALPWAWLTFIQYGQGGAAPAIDNAQKYVYLSARGHLARIERTKLPNLNAGDFEYYRGDDLDGMLDSSWSRNPADGRPARFHRLADSGPDVPIHSRGVTNVVYNHALGRYVGAASSAYFAKGEGFHDTGKTRWIIYTARHPWGPWTEVVSQGIWGIAGWDALLCNKFTSADGRKMWFSFCGEYMGDVWNYGLQYTPVYLSSGPVDRYPAHAARLDGTRIYLDYDNKPAVTGFEKTGSKLTFDLANIEQTGWHIVRIRYACPNANANTLSVYVNDQKVRRLKLSLSNNDYKPDEAWTDRANIYFLRAGRNTFEIRADEGDQAAGTIIDYIAVPRRPTFDEGTNLASRATATASSGEARLAVKGYVDGQTEWVADSPVAQFLKLQWPNPVTVTKVVLYDRANMDDHVFSGSISFSDNTTIKVGKLQNDGQAGTILAFPAKNITSLQFNIETVSPKTNAPGLAEIQVFGESERVAPGTA